MSDQREILIVDDERDFCRLMILMLQREPFLVRCAYSLKEASEVLNKEHPAIILLDHNLPDGTGLDFVMQRKAVIKESAVILITADTSPEMVQRAKDAGIQYLAKPFGLKKIRDIIKQVA
jgi:DNA-binding NtrC family response regulator